MKLDKVEWLNVGQWEDFCTLFGDRGACGGCWCMYWRSHHKEFEAHKGSKNKKALKKQLEAGQPLGVLGYCNDEPVAWCALAPRTDFIRLQRSRILKPVDDKSVWSMPCFFIRKEYRKQGLSRQLIEKIQELAREEGISILEAYPVETRGKKGADVFMYTGIASAFQQAGFREAARRSDKRPVMRYYIEGA